MTDRLSTLLRGEVESLDVPAPPAATILREGRRLRRRRTWVRGGTAALVAVAVLGAGAVTLGHGGSPETAPSSPSSTTPAVAWSVGDTVYLGDEATTATLPQPAQSFYDTSAGLLVRTNKDGSSDGGDPFHFVLVSADGTTTRLGVTLGAVVPSTDPNQPYLAWATMTDGKIQVVIHDVRSDQDVATVDVPGTFDWGGWEAPPVALSGDQVYVGTNGRAEVVDWRTGKAAPSEVVPGSTFPYVAGSHVMVTHGSTTQILDVDSGKVLLDVPSGQPDWFVQMSPDGRFATVSQGMGDGISGGFTIYDVATGSHVRIPATAWGYGWSRDGDEVFSVEGSTLTTCSATTGDCRATRIPRVRPTASADPSSPVPVPPSPRYPGILYEA